MHLGETVVPYAILEPLKALFPLKRGEYALPADGDGPGGIRLGGLERMMRGRWQTISRIWDEHKQRNTRLNLLERLDYHRGFSEQLDWQQGNTDRPIRLVYTSSGQPTAARLYDTMMKLLLRTYYFGSLAKTYKKPTTCWQSSTAMPCMKQQYR